MPVLRVLPAFVIAMATSVASLAAQAQTPSSLVRSASIATPGDKSAGKWTCMSATIVEIAPVSFDTRGLANAWVKVYRDRGEIVAAERISRKEIDQIRRLPCGTRDSALGGIALVG